MQRGCGIVHLREVWAGSLPDADQSLNGGVWFRMGQTRIRQDPGDVPGRDRFQFWVEKLGRTPYGTRSYLSRTRPRGSKAAIAAGLSPLFLPHAGRRRGHALLRGAHARVPAKQWGGRRLTPTTPGPRIT